MTFLRRILGRKFEPGARDADEKLAAFAAGDMAARQEEEFKREMAEDAHLAAEAQSLRETYDAARAWTAEDPPGLERVAGLPVPAPPADAGASAGMRERSGAGESARSEKPGVFRSPVLVWSGRLAAAAMLFAAGVSVGVLGSRDGSAPEVGQPAPSMVERASAEAAAQGEGETMVGEPESSVPQEPEVVVPRKAEDAAPQKLPSSHPVRRVAANDERLIIESSLSRYGSQALFVVDGAFHLADAAQ
jgi:hypothetical protein